jgi:hypothetical protein
MSQRRTKDEGPDFFTAQLFVLLILAALIYPPVRAAIYGLGVVAVTLMVIAFIPVIGLVIFRMLTRSRQASHVHPIAQKQTTQNVPASTEHCRVIARPASRRNLSPVEPPAPEAISTGSRPTTPAKL